MNMTGQLFHLPHDAPGFLFEETHWSTIDGAWAVRHEPTRCIFEITLPDDCDETAPVNALMLGARLIHVCNGHRVPDLEEQEVLAREAMAFWAVEIGIMRSGNAEPSPSDAIPDTLPYLPWVAYDANRHAPRPPCARST